MKFASWCVKFGKKDSSIMIMRNIIQGNHDFPHISTSPEPIRRFMIKRHSPTSLKAFENSWKLFEQCAYATIRIPYYQGKKKVKA